MSDQDEEVQTVELKHVPNNVLAFNERIKPLMDQIMEICRELEIPMIASFQTHPVQLATATMFIEGQLVRGPLVRAAMLLLAHEENTVTQYVEVGESGPLGEPGAKSN